MKSKLTFFTLCTLLFFSCKKDHDLDIDNNCFDSYFEMHNFVPYIGQTHDCKDYVILYEYKNRLYLNRRNFCQRSDGFYETCDGILLNDSNSPIDLSDFLKNAKRGEIVAIEDK